MWKADPNKDRDFMFLHEILQIWGEMAIKIKMLTELSLIHTH